MENENHVNKRDKVIKYIVKIILLVVGLILIFYVITPRIHSGMYDRTATASSIPELIYLLLNHIGFNKWVLNFILSAMLLQTINKWTKIR